MRAATIPKDKAQQVAHLEALFSQVDSRLEVKRVVIPSLSPISDLDLTQISSKIKQDRRLLRRSDKHLAQTLASLS